MQAFSKDIQSRENTKGTNRHKRKSKYMLEVLVRTTAMHEYEERMDDMICFKPLLIDAVEGYFLYRG